MPPRDARPLELLAQRVQAGSRGAAESIVRNRMPHIKNLIRHVVGPAGEIDDMAQVAMITVLHGIPTFRGEGDFSAWMDRVVVRSAIAYAKQRRIQIRRLADAPLEAIVERITRPPHERANDRMRIAPLLDRLSTEKRQAVVMHHMMDLTVPEIAEELDVPVETVRTRLRTALIELRARIDGSR